jgi:hypothetical protein
MVCSRLLTQVVAFDEKVALCGICDTRSGTETCLSPSGSVIPQQLLICHVLGGYSPTCHSRDPVSVPGSSYGIYGGQSGNGTSFASSTSHSFNSHKRFTISVTETVVKYHTTEYHLLFHQCPYSFICRPKAATIETLSAAIRRNSVSNQHQIRN